MAQSVEVINPFKRFVGHVTPESLASSREFTLAEKAVYARLMQFAGKSGVAWPSIQKLADRLALSKRHVIRCIQKLEDRKLIRCNREQGKLTTYEFLQSDLLDKSLRPAKVVTFAKIPSSYMGSDSSATKTDIDPQPTVAVDPLVSEVQTKTEQILHRGTSTDAAETIIATAHGDMGLVRAVLWRLLRRRKPIRSISYILTAIANHITDNRARVLRSCPELSMPVAKPPAVAFSVPDFMECAA